MDEINLPIKYVLSPVNTGSIDVVAYIIVKCYFLEGSITCNIDGTMDAKCKVIECKNTQDAFKTGQINPEYIREVPCVFNDMDIAKEEQRKQNELILEKLKENGIITDLVKFKEKQEATIRSMEKLRSIMEKKYMIKNNQEKRLIYSKE